MITLKSRRWTVIDDLDQIATSWQVATDAEFTNIIVDNVKDSVNVYVYYANVSTPIGSKYYIRAKRHLRDGDGNESELDWTLPKLITSMATDSLLLTLDDIVVDAPIVKVDKEQLLDNTVDTITMETTSYRGSGDGHGSTHWFITDEYDNVIFRQLNDTVNLTSLTIDKSEVAILDKNAIKFKAIHVTGTSVESKAGVTMFSLNTFNFEIVSNMDRAIPYTDYGVVIKRLDTSIGTGLVAAEVKTLEGTLLWRQNYTTNVERIIIPAEILNPRSVYVVDFYSNTSAGKVTYKRKLLKTIEELQSNILDLGYTYTNTIKLAGLVSLGVSPGIVLNEKYNGEILAPLTNSDRLHILKYDRTTDKLVNTEKTVSGCYLFKTINEDTYVRYTVDNKILIDTLNNDNKPTFMVYQYNLFTNTATLLHTIVRDTETTTLGVSNSTIAKLDKLIYYVPELSIIKEYDIINNTITDIATTPLTDATGSVMIPIVDNQYLIVGSADEHCYAYNPETKIFTESAVTHPEFRGRTLKASQLINGDTVIFRTDYKDTDTENNVMLFDYKQSLLTKIEINFNDNIVYDSIVSTRTGELIFNLTDGDSEVNFIYR